MKDKLPKAQSRSEVLLHAIIDGNKTNLPEPKSRIEVLLREIAEIGLKGEDGVGNEGFFGVRFEGSNPIGIRLGLASGLSASVGVDDKIVMNDFDSKFPWSHIRRCNLSDDGQVLRAPYVGGRWNFGAQCGLFAWYCDHAWSSAGAGLGARLSYKPL